MHRVVQPFLATVLACGLAVPAWSQDDEFDLDDILGGFEEEPALNAPFPSESPSEPEDWFTEHVAFLGSVSLGASYNVDPHRSSVGPPPNVAEGTYYGNLQRLRLRTDVQMDISLPAQWRLRSQFYAFYDAAYAIHGQEKYTQPVLDDYVLESEILDLWVAGSVTSWLDLKLGRQVVDWGRSETLRVVDVWNPLNNREPGLVDIEDLRLPVTTARADVYIGSWSVTALVTPEIRYDYNPPVGSDFYPAFRLGDLPPPPPGAPTPEQILAGLGALEPEAFADEPLDRSVSRWGSTPEYALAVHGIFSGWDISFYLARIYQNQTTSVINLPDLSGISFQYDDDRVTMVGLGGNYVTGSWLFKAESAFYDELDYAYLGPNPDYLDPSQDSPYVGLHGQFSRLDWMLGLEYYGYRDWSFSLEVAHRHLFDYDPLLEYLPNYVYQDTVEVAFRVSREMLNARLLWHALGLAIVNNGGFQGAFMRLWFEYEVSESWFLDAGYLQYFGDQQLPFDSWERNNRLFGKLRFRFD